MALLEFKYWADWQKELVDHASANRLVDEWMVHEHEPRAITMRVILPGDERFVRFDAGPAPGDPPISLLERWLFWRVTPMQCLAEINSGPFIVRRLREPDRRVHMSEFDVMVRRALVDHIDRTQPEQREYRDEMLALWDLYVTGEKDPLRDGLNNPIGLAIYEDLYPKATLEPNGWRRPA